MKYIKHLLFAYSILLLGVGCTKYNIIETGLAEQTVKTNLWEYLEKDSYNWSFLIEMIKHSELEDIFKGSSSHGKNITFLGITNHSIRRYMLKNEYENITDIPKDECKKIILNSIINEKITLDDFPEGKPSVDPSETIGEGGKIYTTLSGRKLWIYSYRGVYGGVVGAGPKVIYIVSVETDAKTSVQTSNITTETGIIHVLDYNSFTINDF